MPDDQIARVPHDSVPDTCQWCVGCTDRPLYLLRYPSLPGGVATCEGCYQELHVLTDGGVAFDVLALIVSTDVTD